MGTRMDRDEIMTLTQEYGGEWAIQHAKRLLHLTGLLGQALEYDRDVLWVAAHLHDWGGYPKWAVPGVEHYVRSREVAEEFLAERACPAEFAACVLECIAFHHGGPAGRSIESRLFTDADVLDLLGVVGTLRVFSMVPRNLRAAVERVRSYRDSGLAALSLESSRALAAARVAETNQLLRTFEEETFGMY